MIIAPSNPTSPPSTAANASGSSFILPPSSFPSPPPAAPADAPTAPPPICCFADLPFAALSASDHSLLSALFDPTTSLQSTAATHGLSLLGLAQWLAQPHIQAQVELIESLRALHRQVWADQLRQEAADALREALRDAPDPAERRRCATALLRATSLPPLPRATRSVPLAARPPVLDTPAAPAHLEMSVPHSPAADVAEPPRPERGPGGTEPEAQASATPPLDASMPGSLDASSPPTPPLEASVPRSLVPSIPCCLDASIPRSLDPSPSVASSLRRSVPSYYQALATLRALGHDTTEDELTDDQLDALEDAEADALEDPEFDGEFDVGLDAGLYEYPENLATSGMAQTFADGWLVAPHDTS